MRPKIGSCNRGKARISGKSRSVGHFSRQSRRRLAVDEARERILARLDRLREIDRDKKIAAGWSEWDGEWVPPGFARLGGPRQ